MATAKPKTVKLADKFVGLVQRIRTAVVLLPFVLAAVWFGGLWFFFLIVLAALAMAYEWVGLLQSQQPSRDRLWLSVLLLAVLWFSHVTSATDGLALIAVICLLGGALLVQSGGRTPPVLGGLIYVGWPMAAAIGFHQAPLGALIILYVLVSVWAVDIFAMFCGKIIGGRKLAPRVSPNKTWAGLFGAMAGAMLVASLSFWVLTRFALASVALLDMIAIAAVLAVVAQMADLFESALKRKNDIKDSGAIIPGHGGILDRVDGLVGVFIALHIVALWRGGPVADALWVW